MSILCVDDEPAVAMVVEHALRQAEAVADRTRAALEETQSALRSTREAI